MPSAQPNLHREVVTGIVQMIRVLRQARRDGKSGVPFDELLAVGSEGKSSEAQIFICEFAKDGIPSLRQEVLRRILDGDYTDLWRSANHYLAGFGHPRVEPVPIEL